VVREGEVGVLEEDGFAGGGESAGEGGVKVAER
jgi:hypothetical protein